MPATSANAEKEWTPEEAARNPTFDQEAIKDFEKRPK